MNELIRGMEFLRDYFSVKGKNAEKLVHDLALKTFLTDWCYPNPMLPSGRELCDLLIVFDQVAIIWQIKDLKLDKHGKYKEAEVEKNLRQLSGARRQLFELKSTVELQNPRRRKEVFDATIIKEVYLISVLLGEGEEFHSLVDSIKDYNVHIFTRDFTQIILNELDTISDFTNYLRAKESLLNTNKRIVIIGGEEELLAFYLMNNRSFQGFEEADDIWIEHGAWQHFQSTPEYQGKKELDEISYGWDSIINRAHEGSSEYELIARELARPNRFQRRYLSKVFLDAHIKAHDDEKCDLFRRVLLGDGVTYCFLFFDDEEEPRTKRPAMLHTICYVARGLIQKNSKVIGIATEKKIRPECSYDFCLLDIPEWTEESQMHMEKLQRETGILTAPILGHMREDEYPKMDTN